MLSIEPGLLIWTIITFVCLLIVLRKVAWTPLLTALEQRESTIRNALDASQQARQEAEQLLAENRRILADANRESARIIEQGREESERLRTSIAEQAQAEAKRLVDEARREITRERQLALRELKSTAADLALVAAGKLLSTVVTGAEHRRLVTEFLERFPESVEEQGNSR
jgi:F-type H+-transporting ATPase subunit b